MEDLISIIVPVYNVESFLEQCIRSVIAQTYQNLEIIIVEDCSTDGSRELCKKISSLDNRIKVTYLETNKGLSFARNTGIELAKGKYISFVDSDDIIADNMIETLYHICINENCKISQCAYQIFKNIDEIHKTEKEYPILIKDGKEVIKEMYVGSDAIKIVNSIMACNKLYDITLLKEMRFPIGHINEDEAVMYKIYYYTSKVGITSEPLYYYRKNLDSITNTKFGLKNMYYLTILEERSRFFQKYNELELYWYNLKTYYFTLIKWYVKTKKNIINSKGLQLEIKTKYKSIFMDLLNNNVYGIKSKILIIFARIFPMLYVKLFL